MPGGSLSRDRFIFYAVFMSTLLIKDALETRLELALYTFLGPGMRHGLEILFSWLWQLV